MGLEAGIWAYRLRYRPGGWGGGTKKEEKEKKEKIRHMRESIGHRPLRGRCPKRIKVETRVKEILLFVENCWCLGILLTISKMVSN